MRSRGASCRDELADVLEPELPALTAEILEAIGKEVPEYARPLEGGFGAAVRMGVDEALHRFVALIRDPDSADGASRRVYVALGRGEHRVGRTLDSLQAAYRVGARVAWRRCARAGEAAGLDQATVAGLAEAIFAYIDELSADSVEGYAQAQSEVAGARERRREELVAALINGAAAGRAVEPVDGRRVERAPHRSGGGMPRGAPRQPPSPPRPGRPRRPFEGLGCVVRSRRLGPGPQGACWSSRPRECPSGLGPDLDLAAAPGLLEARQGDARDHRGGRAGRGRRAPGSPARQRGGSRLSSASIARQLAPLSELTPKARARMSATALAYVQHNGNAVAMAAGPGPASADRALPDRPAARADWASEILDPDIALRTRGRPARLGGPARAGA